MNARWIAVVLLLLAALVRPALAQPSTDWPGPAPCNASLQACIDAAPGGAVIVHSSGMVGTGLSLGDRFIFLSAAPGANPVVGSGGITGSGNVVSIEGFRIEGGSIHLSYPGSDAVEYGVRNNDIVAKNPGQSVGIVIEAAAAAMTLDIRNNHVSSGRSLESLAGIDLTLTGGSIELAILHNRVQNLSRIEDDDAGIRLSLIGGGLVTGKLAFNRVDGRFGQGGIALEENGIDAGINGHITAYLYSNAVICSGRQGDGVSANVAHGNIVLTAGFNTVVGCRAGLRAFGWLGVSDGEIHTFLSGNLLAFNQYGYQISTPFQTTMSRTGNLVYGNVSGNTPAPDPGDLQVDPLLVSLQQPYLREGSPAIDQGGPEYNQRIDIGLGLDADGMKRLKGTLSDIGAYEFGNRYAQHRATAANISGNYSRFIAVPDMADATQMPFLTPRYVDGAAVGFPLGAWFDGAWWTVFAEDGTSIPAGLKYNVFVPAKDLRLFVHESSASNSSGQRSRIDPSKLASITDDAQLDAGFVLATQNWLGTADGGAAVYNAFPLTLGYGTVGASPTESWFVANSAPSGGDMPMQARFHIYHQDRSPNAFIVEATQDNALGQTLVLNHPLLNGHPCALPQVTRVLSASGNVDLAPGKHWDLRYIDDQWRIVLQDVFSMPLGMRFFVLVDPRQVYECDGSPFGDGFE